MNMKKRGKNEEITLGKRIESLRTGLGLSMNELAKRVGVSHVQISNYESDSQTPTSAVLKEIATQLETTTDFLLLKVSPIDELEGYFERIKNLPGVEQMKVLEYLRERFEMSEYKQLKSKQFGDVIQRKL